ncbi:hypothetical protein EBU71_00680 [bacterium]|nr:hypothetical protein [Candidatus Elulimicrobium humile]
MANTTIQILRSYANTRPSALDDGELAYSFVSNTFFIGDRTGQIITIGGLTTTENAANTVVLRDENGNINVATVDGGNF